MSRKKVTVVGSGFVGSTTAQRIVDMELADVVLTDILDGPPAGKALDMVEATHGTAPKYADKDVINPGSVMLSGAMMFEFLGWNEAAKLIEDGIARFCAWLKEQS